MGPDATILVFWMLSFKPTLSLSSFTFIKRIFSSSSLSAIRVMSSAYLRLLVFLPAILILACASSSLAYNYSSTTWQSNYSRGLFQLRHECVVTFIGAVLIPRSLALVTEMCKYGSLESAMPKYGPSVWTMKMRVKALYDAARAMEFLHRSFIIHRDFKPDNLLVTSLEPTSPVVCKLSDFGTTKGENTLVHVKKTRDCGTPLYEAPEMLQGRADYDNKVDVYSYGITMAFVADSKEPFADLKHMNSWMFANTIIEGRRPVVTSALPKEYVSLMQSCWQADATKRPEFSSIVICLNKMIQSLQWTV